MISDPTFRTFATGAGVGAAGAGALVLPHPASVNKLRLSNPANTKRNFGLNIYISPLFWMSLSNCFIKSFSSSLLF
ncbi:exported hypothetical protein [Candidatus Desulfosporosinus infrequens]|uniref:Uncharacterized protein n=1 Tax=Candidatus Desulfosporosinus infrequens TaxID=2043169 RepID=A0A2U3LVJ1_9FIRM|nr:exported hypothetical protein [Candidatus Desulfosporosinus infrequens]